MSSNNQIEPKFKKCLKILVILIFLSIINFFIPFSIPIYDDTDMCGCYSEGLDSSEDARTIAMVPEICVDGCTYIGISVFPLVTTIYLFVVGFIFTRRKQSPKKQKRIALCMLMSSIILGILIFTLDIFRYTYTLG